MKNEQASWRAPWSLGVVFVTFVLAVGITGQLYYSRQRAHIKNEKQDYLSAIADIKVAQVNQWRSERLADGKAISKIPLLYDQIVEFRRGNQTGAFASNFRRWLNDLQANYDYESASLMSTDGKVILTDDKKLNIRSGDVSFIRQAVTLQEVLMSDLSRDSAGGEICLDMAVPIAPSGKSILTTNVVMLLRINAKRLFYAMVQSWPTPSRT